MLLAADDGNRVVVLEAKDAVPGDAVIVDGYITPDEEISIDDFLKVSLRTKERKAVFKDQFLKTEKGFVLVDIPDGAKIR